MIISMMAAAAAKGGFIGKNGALPWPKLPRDLKRFRDHTVGKPVIMGRTTFASMNDKPLAKRKNIVLSRSLAARDDVVVVRSLDDAFAAAGDVAEVVVICGAVVYGEALPRAHRIVLTIVEGDLDGDTAFPDPGPGWRCDPSSTSFLPKDDTQPFDMRFYDLWRPAQAPAGSVPFSWDLATGRVSPT